jgi:hypothetical protein
MQQCTVHCLYFVFVAGYSMCTRAILAINDGPLRLKKKIFNQKNPRRNGVSFELVRQQQKFRKSEMENWQAKKRQNKLKLGSRKRICQRSSYLQRK